MGRQPAAWLEGEKTKTKKKKTRGSATYWTVLAAFVVELFLRLEDAAPLAGPDRTEVIGDTRMRQLGDLLRHFVALLFIHQFVVVLPVAHLQC